MDRQKNRQMDGQKERYTDRQTERVQQISISNMNRTDRQTIRSGGQNKRQTDERQTGSRVDCDHKAQSGTIHRTDGQTFRQTGRC